MDASRRPECTIALDAMASLYKEMSTVTLDIVVEAYLNNLYMVSLDIMAKATWRLRTTNYINDVFSRYSHNQQRIPQIRIIDLHINSNMATMSPESFMSYFLL
ncbi:unnamed protein product [Cuscuta epithymum]|uniref:Uncharacterized protein n=1 Tax=Cuscuta epithymum TaxID=186058 RepID=A0AAV0GH69_9ASTE|nr:unnamed protein product [Cuscuta epithymum]CAH9135302.1 unnamed protein product [Cuscuta epithymum]CAH9146529.1 unnamed protein product [Cuscuta epithymum]